ncbi:MAG: SusD/RagB family nutrient-binding outer membrane lipoprotein [Bacteroidota bacterium]
MKKQFNILLATLAILAMPMSSCDNDFDVTNTNPNVINEIDYNTLLTHAMLETSGGRYENWRAGLIYSSTMIQHFATLPGYWSGDKYLYNAGYSSSLFDRNYPSTVKSMVDILDKTEPSSNIYNVTLIWWVATMHRLTDMYGDVPYSEAGKGFIDGNFRPQYDAQSDIYADMLAKLETAAGALNGGGDVVTGDFMFGGDVNLWKKYAYSLMLRLGMRMSKVDAAAAQQWVGKAIAGGVMSDISESALVPHTDGPGGINRNGIGEVFNWNGTRFATDDSPRLSEFFVNWMLDNNDPRLDKLGVVANGGPHMGLPNGLDATSIQTAPGGSDLEAYDRITHLVVLRESPMLFQTYAEVELLLAEASERGWHSGDAKTHFENGVRAAIDQWAAFDGSLAVDGADTDAYIAGLNYTAGGADALKMIGEQYWAATFLNEYEAYANYRRTGFPELVPTNYPGNESNGQIPRRLRYPTSEYGVNEVNINAANARQGEDVFTTRIWWDS